MGIKTYNLHALKHRPVSLEVEKTNARSPFTAVESDVGAVIQRGRQLERISGQPGRLFEGKVCSVVHSTKAVPRCSALT